MDNITFITNCWEKDWEYVLSNDRLKNIIDNNPYDFEKKFLIINNVENSTRKSVIKAAENAVQIGAFTDYYFVDEYYKQALDSFGLDKKDMTFGFEYAHSISQWVGIFLSNTKFILYYMGDCIASSNYNWVDPSIKLLNENTDIKACNPIWNHELAMARYESFAELKDFFISYAFSDQCFLVRSEDFKQKIYSEYHPSSEKYPTYGGNCFEKRIYSWMVNNNYKRATFKHSSYIHKNWK